MNIVGDGVDTENVVGALLRFFLLEFTFRKVASLCLILTIILIAIWGYDRVTGNLSIGRVTSAVEALDKLSKIDLSKPENQDLIPVRKEMIVAIENEVSPKIIGSSNISSATIAFERWISSGNTWAQFCAGAFLWFSISIIGLVMMFRNESTGFEVFRTLGIVALVAGFIGGLLPSNFWINYVAYPIGSFALITLIALISKKRQETKNAGSAVMNQEEGNSGPVS